MATRPGIQSRLWSFSAEAKDTPEGRRFDVTFSVLAKHAVRFLDLTEDEQVATDRDVARLVYGDDAEAADLMAWMMYFARQLDPNPPVGRPAETHGPALLEKYKGWRAANPPPVPDSTFFRRHMGAENDKEIRRCRSALSRARNSKLQS